MTYAPVTLTLLAGYWVSQGGVNLGIVGNTAHRVGYHLGKDRIYDGSGPGLGDADYSVKSSRDKAGLSNAASAIDLGRLDGSLTQLRAFSEWLVQRALHGECHDIREIIYSTVDGVYVKRWSGPDNRVYTSLKKTAGGIVTVTPQNGDSSHYTHTHISFYRDSEDRSKVGLFSPYFGASEGSDVVKPITTTIPKTIAWGDGTPYFALDGVTQVGTAAASSGRYSPFGCGTMRAFYRGDKQLALVTPTLVEDVAPVVDATPFSQADIDAAVAVAKADALVDTQLADAFRAASRVIVQAGAPAAVGGL